MTESITFFVPGRPYAKKRPRFGQGRTYTDPETVAAEHAVRWYFKRHLVPYQEHPLEGPIRVEVTACFAPADSWSEKKKLASRNAPHVGRPDLDNVVKLLDALNPMYDRKQKPPKLLWCGAWKDDGQICELVARKRYVGPDEQEGTTVTITPLETHS